MKQFLRIYIWLILICFGCAQNSEKQNEAYAEEVEATETADISSESGLDNYKLEAYEQRAIQKLEDFAAYLEIISNPDYDDAFRTQAMDMTKGLFSNGSIQDSTITQSLNTYKIDEFLKQLLAQNYGTIAPKYKRVKVIQPFEYNEKEQLLAKLSFVQKINQIKSQKIAIVSLSEVTKSFGQQEETVWNVSLVSIEYP